MEDTEVDHVEETKLSQFIEEEVIEVDQLKETNNGRLSWAMPHSGLKKINVKELNT